MRPKSTKHSKKKHTHTPGRPKVNGAALICEPFFSQTVVIIYLPKDQLSAGKTSMQIKGQHTQINGQHLSFWQKRTQSKGHQFYQKQWPLIYLIFLFLQNLAIEKNLQIKGQHTQIKGHHFWCKHQKCHLVLFIPIETVMQIKGHHPPQRQMCCNWDRKHPTESTPQRKLICMFVL